MHFFLNRLINFEIPGEAGKAWVIRSAISGMGLDFGKGRRIQCFDANGRQNGWDNQAETETVMDYVGHVSDCLAKKLKSKKFTIFGIICVPDGTRVARFT